MKFLFASDSFKGTLSSPKTAELLTCAAREIFPDCICDSIEVADGGEGTTDAVLSAVNGKSNSLKVHGPLWEELTCSYGMLDEKRAVMEMAAASGLPLVPDEKRDPRYTTSYGTGEMILDALNKGFRDISIAIGGSATNDGGIGCIRALGVRFLDENGEELKGCGEDLIKIRKIDVSDMNPLVKECNFTVMCDVTNPLCGKDGATYTFGKQKGATPEIQDELEKGMQNYRDILKAQFGVDMDQIEGAGAAGGLGAALMVFLKGTLKTCIKNNIWFYASFQRSLQENHQCCSKPACCSGTFYLIHIDTKLCFQDITVVLHSFFQLILNLRCCTFLFSECIGRTVFSAQRIGHVTHYREIAFFYKRIHIGYINLADFDQIFATTFQLFPVFIKETYTQCADAADSAIVCCRTTDCYGNITEAFI